MGRQDGSRRPRPAATPVLAWVAGLVAVEGSYVRESGFTVQDVAGTASQMGIRTLWGSSHFELSFNNNTIDIGAFD